MADVLTLDDLLKMPQGISQDALRGRGLLPPLAPPTAPPRPNPEPVAPMVPPAASSPVVPSIAPMVSAGKSLSEVAPMAPPANKETFQRQEDEFKNRLTALDPSSPTYASDLAGTELQKNVYEGQHPWGTPESAHPGLGGKIGHVLGEIGQVAAPGLAERIPGSNLERLANEKAEIGQLDTAKKTESQEALQQSEEGKNKAEQEDLTPVPFALSDGTEIPLAPKYHAALQREIEHGKTAEDIQEQKGQTAEHIAGENIGSKEKIAGENIASRENVATQHNLTAEDIAAKNRALRQGIAAASRELQRWKTTEGGGKVAPLVGKAYDDYENSVSRLNIMQQNYEKALGGDQQAMLSLLANHIGMTMGLQKGARITQALLQEAESSAPALGRFQARFDKDGYLMGVVLTPEQMHSMVDLGVGRMQQDHRKFQDMQTFYGNHGDTNPGGGGNADMIQVQIPGHPAGQIHKSSLANSRKTILTRK